MVISRPAGTGDVGYQMVARPLLERLEAVRGQVDLTVPRPRDVQGAAPGGDAGSRGRGTVPRGDFDGHGAMPDRWVGGVARGRAMTDSPGEGLLAFELPGGGSSLCGRRGSRRCWPTGGCRWRC